jgi:hypothetical protein
MEKAVVELLQNMAGYGGNAVKMAKGGAISILTKLLGSSVEASVRVTAICALGNMCSANCMKIKVGSIICIG